MLDILDVFIDRFIKAVANAEIILPASYRVSLLTNWLSTLDNLISYILATGLKVHWRKE